MIASINFSGRRIREPHRVLCRSFASRRRRRTLPNLPSTKKEKLRSSFVVQQSETSSDAAVSMDATQIGDQVEGRLLQMRQFIKDIWQASPVSEQQASKRPPRVGPVMDRRWWTWNIALALLPAALLGLYAEFIGKPRMEEFFRKQKEEQQARLLGILEDDESEVSAIVPVASGGNVETGGYVEDMSGRIRTDEDSLAALRHRIEHMEAELMRRQRRDEQQQKYHIQRLNQSGIQNRIEDRLVEQWKNEHSKPETNTEPAENKTLTESMAHAVKAQLKENLRRNVEAVEQQAISMKDRIMKGWEAKSEPADSQLNSSGPTTVCSKDSQSQEHETVEATKVAAASAQKAAEMVQSSLVTNNPRAMASAAVAAAASADTASKAAQRAANAVPVNAKSEESYLLRRIWKRFFAIGHDQSHSNVESDQS